MKNKLVKIGFVSLLLVSTIAVAQNVATEIVNKNLLLKQGKSIRMNSADNTHYIKIYQNGSTPTITTDTGAVSFPNGISATITGNAATATALAANPSDCSANQFATTIAASGNLTCSNLSTYAAALGATTVTASSTITSTATSDIGWAIVPGANTACNTTCTSACVIGWDTSSGEVVKACSDNTADKCLCAGAN